MSPQPRHSPRQQPRREIHAHNARDNDGDLVLDLLNYDRSRLVEFDDVAPKSSFSIDILFMLPAPLGGRRYPHNLVAPQ
jgi:hypothetical protein